MPIVPAGHPDAVPVAALERIAAALDLGPEGDDAAVLAAAITRATGGDLLLLAIEPDLPLLVPGLDRKSIRQETTKMLSGRRDALAPAARTIVDSDISIARAIKRIIDQQHRQLLACGSSRHGPAGQVSLGRTTRQLIDRVPCSLALAPRGLSAGGELTFARIGVGFEGGAESRAALAIAAALAQRSGAELLVRGVVDDQMPSLGWPGLWLGPIQGLVAGGHGRRGRLDADAARRRDRRAAGGGDRSRSSATFRRLRSPTSPPTSTCW